MLTQPLVVEFAGLPGAGKTTLARKTIEKLELAGYKCFTRDTFNKQANLTHAWKNKFLNYIPYAVQKLAALLYCLSFAMHITPINKTSIKRIFYLFVMRRYLDNLIASANENQYDVIVLDQSLIQGIWSSVLTGRPPPDKYLLGLIKSLCNYNSPFIIINVNVDIDTALERIRQRPVMQSRFDKMSPCRAEFALRKYDDYLGKIIDFTVHYTGARHYKVNGREDLYKNTQSIIEQIFNYQKVYENL